MSEIIYGDCVDINGVAHKTVGENIRKGAKDTSTLIDSLGNDTEKAKMCDALGVSSTELKEAIVDLLSGKKAHFGGLDTTKLTETQINTIKANLGITGA